MVGLLREATTLFVHFLSNTVQASVDVLGQLIK